MAPSYNHALSELLFATRSTSAQLDTDLEAEFGSLLSFLHVFVGNVERTTSTVTILKGSLGYIHTRWLIGCLVINSKPCGVVNTVGFIETSSWFCRFCSISW